MTPIFCDVLEDIFNIDPECRAVSLSPKVILVVDLFGHPADYRETTHIACDCDVKLLADAAQC